MRYSEFKKIFKRKKKPRPRSWRDVSEYTGIEVTGTLSGQGFKVWIWLN